MEILRTDILRRLNNHLDNIETISQKTVNNCEKSCGQFVDTQRGEMEDNVSRYYALAEFANDNKLISSPEIGEMDKRVLLAYSRRNQALIYGKPIGSTEALPVRNS